MDGHIVARCLRGAGDSVNVREMFSSVAKKQKKRDKRADAPPRLAPARAGLPATPPSEPPAPPSPAPTDVAGPLPVLADLHQRHPGFYANLCGAYADAARVCLSRHHESPQLLRIQDEVTNTERNIAWHPPTAQVRAAWDNSDDATRDGAYAVSLATVEVTRSLVAVGRARTKSGADWLLVPAAEVEPDDFEGTIRLEVSGVDEGTVGARFNEKVKQAQAGDSNLPAIVSVVGFQALRVRVGDVEQPS